METNTAKIIKRLKQDGWRFERHGGNHDVYRQTGKMDIVVPRHKEVSSGVARSIAKQAGWAD